MATIYSVGQTIHYQSNIGKVRGKIKSIDVLNASAIINGKEPKDIINDTSLGISVMSVSKENLHHSLISVTSGAILCGDDVLFADTYEDKLRKGVIDAIKSKVLNTPKHSLRMTDYSVNMMNIEFNDDETVFIADDPVQGDGCVYYSFLMGEERVSEDLDAMEMCDLLSLARDVMYAEV